MGDKIFRVLLLSCNHRIYVTINNFLDKIKTNYSLEVISAPVNINKKIESNSYSLCILDIDFYEMAGIDLSISSKSFNNNLPIILLKNDNRVKNKLTMINKSVYVIDKNLLDEISFEKAIKYSLERKKVISRITNFSKYDQLTNLPNKVLCSEKLNKILKKALKEKKEFSIMCIDVDDFKRVNESLGYDNGDILLKEISNRLYNLIDRKFNFIKRNEFDLGIFGRWYGDKFLIVLDNITNLSVISDIANKINLEFKKSFYVINKKLSITVSVGISIYPKDGKDVELLVKNSEQAMNKAKFSGKNNYHF